MATSDDHEPKDMPPQKRERLNVLLSNGRFPGTLDLPRELRKARHRVYFVDHMQFHVCKFSIAVKKRWQTSAPAKDPAGYIAALSKVVRDKKIVVIIPMHEVSTGGKKSARGRGELLSLCLP